MNPTTLQQAQDQLAVELAASAQNDANNVLSVAQYTQRAHTFASEITALQAKIVALTPAP